MLNRLQEKCGGTKSENQNVKVGLILQEETTKLINICEGNCVTGSFRKVVNPAILYEQQCEGCPKKCRCEELSAPMILSLVICYNF